MSINNNLSYNLSMEECFRINECLVNGNQQSFNKNFTLYDTFIGDLEVGVEFKFNSEFVTVILTHTKKGEILKERVFDISKYEDIKDILGLYIFRFKFIGKDCVIRVNLFINYEEEYFESIQDYLKAQLDLLKYKRIVNKTQELLNYIYFFDRSNSFSRCCACYILELLKDTTHFNSAKFGLIFVLSPPSYKGLGVSFYSIRKNSETREDIEGFIKVVLDKKDSLLITENALITIYMVVLDEREPYDKLILSTLDEKKVYDAICTGLKEIKSIPLF